MMDTQVIIIGLGKTGLSCVNHLLSQGIVPLVVDSRAHPPGLEQLPPEIKCLSGPFSAERFQGAKTLVISPGVALTTPAIQAALTQGVEVVGDIELFARQCNIPIVAITGSNGKSTVTMLVAEMAKAAGLRIGVGGNIGTPALDLLKQPMDLCVLELSSFQLETTSTLRPTVATILNLCEDHMDRYDSFHDYVLAKQRIYDGATCCIFNREEALTAHHDKTQNSQSFGFSGAEYGLIEHDDEIWLSIHGQPQLAVRELKTLGRHNQLNALAAMALADSVGIERTAQLEALRSFSGLAHRCQLVRIHRGVLWVNDSKATNVGSTLAAIEGMRQICQGRLFLLLGGQGKGQDFSPLQQALTHVHQILCYGEDQQKLLALHPHSIACDDLTSAIAYCAAHVKSGDLVLLAPACASLDQFSNFEARGELFQKRVNELC